MKANSFQWESIITEKVPSLRVVTRVMTQNVCNVLRMCFLLRDEIGNNRYLINKKDIFEHNVNITTIILIILVAL